MTEKKQTMSNKIQYKKPVVYSGSIFNTVPPCVKYDSPYARLLMTNRKV